MKTEVLVVEGWVHPYAINAAAAEFGTGQYQLVLATGGPVPGLGRYINDFQTSAGVGADELKAAGVPAARVMAVPARYSSRDRTYASALALRHWLERERLPYRAFNVLTEDTHGRRTRLLYRRAFGPGFEIGIISVPNPDYESHRWWRYSEGVRKVLSESIAYLYALVWFKVESETP